MGKKQENEFSRALDELEDKVQQLNEQKKIHSRRLVKIQDYLEQKEAEKKDGLKLETQVAKKGAVRDRWGVAVSVAIVAAMFIVPYYQKDPVEFWRNVIIGVGFFGFFVIYKTSK